MPNHVVNEIRLHGVPLARVEPLIRGKDCAIDFGTLVPLPINFWPGGVGAEHAQAFPGTWLDAGRAQWGTKWNAYALGDHSVCEDAGDTVLTFETAWSPPRGWVVALFNTLDCSITHFWQDEGSADVWRETYRPAKASRYAAGPEWSREKVEHEGTDYRRLYKLQWGVETEAELADAD